MCLEAWEVISMEPPIYLTDVLHFLCLGPSRVLGSGMACSPSSPCVRNGRVQHLPPRPFSVSLTSNLLKLCSVSRYLSNPIYQNRWSLLTGQCW